MFGLSVIRFSPSPRKRCLAGLRIIVANPAFSGCGIKWLHAAYAAAGPMLHLPLEGILETQLFRSVRQNITSNAGVNDMLNFPSRMSKLHAAPVTAASQ